MNWGVQGVRIPPPSQQPHVRIGEKVCLIPPVQGLGCVTDAHLGSRLEGLAGCGDADVPPSGQVVFSHFGVPFGLCQGSESYVRKFQLHHLVQVLGKSIG